MTAGLQIINDSGVVQLDENYFNLEFKNKFQYAIATGINQYTIATNGYGNEVVAVGETGAGYVNIARTANNKIVITTFATAATTLTFYVFGTPDQTATASAGMQIFNSAGQITFSATQNYMRVVHSYKTLDIANMRYASGNPITLGAGIYAAVSSSNRRILMNAIDYGAKAMRIDALRVNGSTVDVTPQWITGPNGQFSWETLYENGIGGWVTVIDVSGL